MVRLGVVLVLGVLVDGLPKLTVPVGVRSFDISLSMGKYIKLLPPSTSSMTLVEFENTD